MSERLSPIQQRHLDRVSFYLQNETNKNLTTVLLRCCTDLNMPTTLPRVKPTVAKEINKILFQLAKRDQMSVSAKTLELLKQAIEIEENITLIKLSETRERKKKQPTRFS